MAAVTICSDFGAPQNKVCHCFHCFSIYLPWSDRTRCHDLSILAWRILARSCRGSWQATVHGVGRVGHNLVTKPPPPPTGIPSPPLTLFIVMLPKALLTSHTRISGCWWVITPLWLSGSWRSFLYSSSVYCYPLFLISSASVRSIPFLSFIVPIFAWHVPLLSLIFLKRSLDFPILLFSSISFHWLLREAFLSLLAIFWNSAFKWVYLSFSPLPFTSLLFTAICKASSENHFAFLHFFFLKKVLITASCKRSWTSVIVLEALSLYIP